MLLNGLVFDADGQPTLPVIASARKRRYRYYAFAPLVRSGLPADHDDAIRRVPATALEPIVEAVATKAVGCAEGGDAAVSLRSIVGRVEVHSSTVQIVLRTCANPGKPTFADVIDSIRHRLKLGEQVLADPSHLGLIRVVLPVRLAVRGGRTWVDRPDRHLDHSAGTQDRRLIRALRAGHAVLRKCAIEPESLAASTWKHAVAPRTGRDRWLARLAFLAPDIQRDILRGYQAKPGDHPDWRKIPLSWAAQRAIFAAAPSWHEDTHRSIGSYPV